MSKIVSVILDNGNTMGVSHLGLDHTTLEHVVRAGKIAEVKVLGINLYNAKDAPFCLGSKTYRNASEARDNASTRKGNYFSSFEVEYSFGARTMKLRNGGYGESPAYVRYAVFNGRTFEKPSYSSLSAARAAAGFGSLIVEIGVRGTKVVSVRAVG